MATLLFHEWFQDHPFDPSDRHLMKRGEKPSRSEGPDQYERRKAREHRRANRRHEKRTGETLDEAKARREAERAAAREKARQEQAKMAEKMTDIVNDRVDEVGKMNADVLIARIEGKRDAGELNEEQLANLDQALSELEKIHAKRESQEITADAYRTLIQHFTASHLDLVLTSEEVTRLQAMVDSRLEAYEANAARVDVARETRNLSELEELALAFVTEKGSGDHPNIDAERLKAGAVYNIDFHNPDGSLNRYAHNNVILGHIMTGTKLKKVHIKKDNGKYEGPAYLHSDGKTYTNPPWEETKGSYVGIVSGDSFTVLKDSYATAPTATKAADVIAAQDLDEARTETAQFDLEVSHDDREALLEAERTLDSGYKVDIPADVAALKGADLEQQLRGMDMGDFVIQICEEFAGLKGSVAESASGTSLFISIMEKGNRSKIALKEITKAVFGVNDKKFMEAYKETRQEAQTLRWLEHFMVQEKADNPDMTNAEFFAKAQAAMGDNPEDRAVLYKYNEDTRQMFDSFEAGETRESIKRTASVREVFSTRKIHKKFMLGAHRLLKAVPLMKVSNYADTSMDRSLDKSDQLSNVAEPAIAAIFPPDKDTPVTKAGVWSNITRRTGRNATMGNIGTRVVYEETMRHDGAEEYERMFSSLYAYNDIRDKVTSIEDGVEVVDLQLLAETLEMYRKQGKILMDKGMLETRRDDRETRGRRVMYPDEPITVDVLGKMDVSPMTIELIQHGMMVEKMKDYSKLKERVINAFPNDIGNQLEAIDGQYEFTPDELREIGDNIRMAQIAMIHFTKNEVQHLNAQGKIPEKGRNGRPVNPIERNIGISKGFTVFEDGKNTIKLNMGINYNWMVDEFVPKSSEQTFTFGLGPSYTKTFGKEERNHIGIGAGVAGPFPGEGNWGAAGSLSYTHDWGEYQRFSSGVSLAAGAPLGTGTPFMEQLALVHAGVTILDVDQANVISRRADYEFRDMQKSYEAKIALLDAKFDEETGSLDHLSPEQVKQVKAQVFEHYKEDIIFAEIDDMSHIRFDKIGVSAIATPPYFMVHLGVAFKGKTQMFYMKPDHMDLDALASQAIAQKAAEAGGEGYTILDVSGNLVVTSEGERTYARDMKESFDPYDDLDGANKYLMEHQGVKIERASGSGEFRLLPLQVDGLVEVYADNNEGIYAYPSDGEFYFSIPAGTDLAIHRHTHVMPLPDGGVQEITKFYITDNPHKTPEQVAKSHTHHVEGYVSQREGGRNSKVEKRQHILAEQVVKNYEEEILEWSTPDVLAAQANLDTAFNSFHGYVGIGRQRYLNMETAVKAQSSRIKASISLKEATLSGSREAYARALMKEAQPLIDQLKIDPNNSAEMTAILQLILIEDRSTAPTDPEKFIQHIEEWNRASLEQSLNKSGVPNADQIARKITSYYAVNMLQAMKDGRMKMPETKVERSALVHTHIGHRPGGNVMEFMNGMQDSVALEGAMVLDDGLLEHHMHLTKPEIKELKRALTEQMAPVDFNNPDTLFQHPIALQVLESGAVFFGPEYANALAEINDVQDASALAGKQAEAYKAFSDVMKDLTKEDGPGVKTAKYGGRSIRVRVDMQIGFINKCRNFTSTYRAERVQGVSGQADRTDEGVRARAAVNFAGAEVAAGMRVEEKEHDGGKNTKDHEKEPKGTGGDDRDDLDGSDTGGDDAHEGEGPAAGGDEGMWGDEDDSSGSNSGSGWRPGRGWRPGNGPFGGKKPKK